MSLKLEVSETEARRIAEIIADTESPVGIDAKKTHVLIIRKLLDIEARLDVLERLIAR